MYGDGIMAFTRVELLILRDMGHIVRDFLASPQGVLRRQKYWRWGSLILIPLSKVLAYLQVIFTFMRIELLLGFDLTYFSWNQESNWRGLLLRLKYFELSFPKLFYSQQYFSFLELLLNVIFLFHSFRHFAILNRKQTEILR